MYLPAARESAKLAEQGELPGFSGGDHEEDIVKRKRLFLQGVVRNRIVRGEVGILRQELSGTVIIGGQQIVVAYLTQFPGAKLTIMAPFSTSTG